MNFELSEFTDSDLENIYDFSFREFGFLQAEEYLEGVHHLFEQLTLFLDEGVFRKDIAENIRSIPYKSHIVFYSIYEKSILIVRVLHQSQDVYKFFQ